MHSHQRLSVPVRLGPPWVGWRARFGGSYQSLPGSIEPKVGTIERNDRFGRHSRLSEARMSQVAFTNKCGLLVGAAMLISAVAAPAHAQNVPPGSYLRSCTNVQTQGDRLVADCRRADGSWSRTALDVDRCVGGIANMDGRLTCNGNDRSQGRSRDQNRRGYDRAPDYGSSYGYGPQGGYGR